MSANPRQLQLLHTVQQQGSATVENLAETLGVTLQTVRRDVQKLADEGLLARFHGGVRVPSSTVETLPTGNECNCTPPRKPASPAALRLPFLTIAPSY